MASSLDFIEFICSQIEEAGTVRYRKMFGEYMVYLDEKPVILVCNDIAYIKQHPSVSDIMQAQRSITFWMLNTNILYWKP